MRFRRSEHQNCRHRARGLLLSQPTGPDGVPPGGHQAGAGLQKLQTRIQLLLQEETARARMQTRAGATPPEAQTHRQQRGPSPSGGLLVPLWAWRGQTAQSRSASGRGCRVRRLGLNNWATTLLCENQGTVWVEPSCDPGIRNLSRDSSPLGGRHVSSKDFSASTNILAECLDSFFPLCPCQLPSSFPYALWSLSPSPSSHWGMSQCPGPTRAH